MSLQKVGHDMWRDLRRAAAVRNYRMSVDPGIRGTGVALWDSSRWKDPEDEPILVSAFTPPGDLAWIAAARWVMEGINALLVGLPSPMKMKGLYIEMPQYFGVGNAAGEMVAARGDLQKLAFMTGMISSFGWYKRCKIRPYEVNAWKGQLSKKQTEERIKKILPGLKVLKVANHGWDAVGIGLYAKGLF